MSNDADQEGRMAGDLEALRCALRDELVSLQTQIARLEQLVTDSTTRRRKPRRARLHLVTPLGRDGST